MFSINAYFYREQFGRDILAIALASMDGFFDLHCVLSYLVTFYSY